MTHRVPLLPSLVDAARVTLPLPSTMELATPANALELLNWRLPLEPPGDVGLTHATLEPVVLRTCPLVPAEADPSTTVASNVVVPSKSAPVWNVALPPTFMSPRPSTSHRVVAVPPLFSGLLTVSTFAP